ncbi:MAG TPA: AMP-binding protein [Verrucomicrobiae bacterium]|jgi:phenylacetate-CoA ligase
MAEAFPKRLTIAQTQTEQMRALLAAILPANAFQSKRLETHGVTRRISNLSQFYEEIPFTTKQELIDDQLANPPFGTNLTYPRERYNRCHQTSGTVAKPLRWLDTPESWNWMIGNWERVHRAAGVTKADRVFFAFSFGPFLGFWLAFEAGARIGCVCLPGGGMSSAARLQTIIDMEATVLCCTPTYALRLAEVATEEGIGLAAASRVRVLIVAGEAGGSIPALRQRLEQLWPSARVFDHHGMTEVGPVSYECPVRPGVLHVMETGYLAEVIDPVTAQRTPAGQTGELVLTPLGRLGSPLLRYRTGDLVKTALDSVCECGRYELALEGGILGRLDDMVVVRGVNIYPSAVEEIIRSTAGVTEFQVKISQAREMTELTVEIEPPPDTPDSGLLVHKLEAALSAAFALRVPVQAVAPGSLPRHEMKANRWVKV